MSKNAGGFIFRASFVSILSLAAGCGQDGRVMKDGRLESVAKVQQNIEYDTDEDNCGGDGYKCVGGRECVSSRCTPAWLPMSTTGAPSARAVTAGGERNGKFVVFGGCTSMTYSAQPDNGGGQYDPATDTWSSIPTLNYRRAQHSSATTPNGIYTFGGISLCWNGSQVLSSVEVFDKNLSAWSAPSIDMSGLSGRYGNFLVWTGSEVAMFGGASNTVSRLLNGGHVSIGTPWKPMAACTGSSYCGNADINTMIYDHGNGTGGPDGNWDTSNHPAGKGILRTMGSMTTGSGYELVYDLETNAWREQFIPDGGIYDFTEIDKLQYAEDGRRAYFMKSNGKVIWYDRKDQVSSEDSSAQPSGLCNNGAKAWVSGEVITWGGYCNGGLSSVGGRYQPAAVSN